MKANLKGAALTWLTVITIIGLLTGGILALGGAPAEEASFQEDPYSLPPIREGDAARYTTAAGSGAVLHVRVLPSEAITNATQTVRTLVLDLREDRGSFWQNTTYFLDPGTGAPVAKRFLLEWSSEHAGFYGIPVPTSTTDASMWEVTHLDEGTPPLCGLWNPFQGASRGLDASPTGPCKGADAAWRAVADQESEEGRMVRFQVDRTEVTLRDDLPFPLRTDDWVLDGFARGTGPVVATKATPARLPEVRTVARTEWTLEDRTLDHPFPLAAAYRAVLEDEGGQVAEFLRDHPEAYLHQTGYGAVHYPDRDDYTWSLVFGDGETVLKAHAIRRATESDLPSVGPVAMREEVLVEVDDPEPALADIPPKALLPKEIPRLEDLMARYSAIYGEEARDYGFSFACSDCGAAAYGGRGAGQTISEPPCETDDCPVLLQVHIGNSQGTFRYATEEGAFVFDYHQRMLALDADGTPYMHSVSSRASQMVQAPVEPVATEPFTATGPQSVDPVSVAGWGAIGLGSGIALLLTAKFLLGALFTRLHRNKLLEHPMRSRIQDAVAADPGIHYQELARRVDLPQGTLRHHLQALEQAGLLRSVKGPRHTCYFLAGTTDRHVQTAAPLLRSAGARRVLAVVEAEPGLGTNAVAERVGMSPSSVHAHLKRLAAAGIVDGGPASGRRAWRVLRPQVAAWAAGVAPVEA